MQAGNELTEQLVGGEIAGCPVALRLKTCPGDDHGRAALENSAVTSLMERFDEADARTDV
jgi:hypothetical protein